MVCHIYGLDIYNICLYLIFGSLLLICSVWFSEPAWLDTKENGSLGEKNYK